MVSIGVDGCRVGWFYVKAERTACEFGVVAQLRELVVHAAADWRIYVDIPIGLRDDSGIPRGCDAAARKLLGGKRASSVFPAPIRAILSLSCYRKATAKSKELCGKGISRQAFAIMPKIREVDELLSTHDLARRIVREVHPELCFWGLAGRRAMAHRKKTPEGFNERLALLGQVLPNASAIATAAMDRYLRKEVARDDILDALVATVTAMAPKRSQKTAPAEPEKDSLGLPMEMVYSERARQDLEGTVPRIDL